MTKKGLNESLHSKSGVYNSIHYRFLLYDAMCRRDFKILSDVLSLFDQQQQLLSSTNTTTNTPSVISTTTIPTISSNSIGTLTTIQGGMAYIYAKRIQAEIIALQRTYKDVSQLAKQYSEIGNYIYFIYTIYLFIYTIFIYLYILFDIHGTCYNIL